MSPSGVLINIGRGDVVNESDLYEALRTRTIGGAVLDVWWNVSATAVIEDDGDVVILPCPRVKTELLDGQKKNGLDFAVWVFDVLRVLVVGHLYSSTGRCRAGQLAIQVSFRSTAQRTHDATRLW